VRLIPSTVTPAGEQPGAIFEVLLPLAPDPDPAA
jgi:hypothetical protein